MNKTYKLTGLFVLIGIIGFVLIVGYFIRQKYAVDNNKSLVIMYFDESVRGLSVGSPIVLQGVEIGKVAKIRLMVNTKNGTFKTPVYMRFNGDDPSHIPTKAEKQRLKHLIDLGLRARLVTANFLTGQLMIELGMAPNVEAVYRGTGKYPEIPTMYSSFAQISKDLEEIPLQDTIIRVGNLINNIDDTLPDILKNIAQITEDFGKTAPDTMKNLNNLAESLNKDVPSLLQNLNGISTKLNVAMSKRAGGADKTIENVNIMLEEVSKASRSLKNLTDYLERHPEALIQGKDK